MYNIFVFLILTGDTKILYLALLGLCCVHGKIEALVGRCQVAIMMNY